MNLRFLSGAAAAAGVALVTGCTSESVVLSVYNAGSEPMRCTVLFGHWVEQGAEPIAPEEGLHLRLQRQSQDGALFVRREDGRKMMVENLVCGPIDAWWERRADVSLLPLRAGQDQDFVAFCRTDGGFECFGPTGVPPSQR